ncbi:MAG: AAA family ATPase [Proteocatella sp.]
MEINTIIISKLDERREFLKKLLEETDIKVISDIRGGTAALDRIENISPELVIMTFDEHDTDVLNIAERIYLGRPQCIIIFLVDRMSTDILQKAMSAGVRNVTIFPENGYDFSEWLKTIYNNEKMRSKSMVEMKSISWMSKVITVFGAKGGIGKTTIAVNLAAKLAENNKKVALLDFDIEFGEISVYLNLDVKDTLAELITEKSEFDIDTIRSYMNFHSSGVHVLCAPKSPEYSEGINANQIEKLMNILRTYYDYVIIDTPASFNDITLTAIEGSVMVVFVTGFDISILRNSKLSMNLLEGLQQKEKIKIVVNRDVEGYITAKDVERILGKNIWCRIPSDYNTAVSALNKGIPIVIGSPKTRISFALDELAKLVLGEFEHTYQTQKKSEESSKHNFFDKLRRTK